MHVPLLDGKAWLDRLDLGLEPFLRVDFLGVSDPVPSKIFQKLFADIFWSFHFSGNPPDVHEACQDYKIQYEHAKH